MMLKAIALKLNMNFFVGCRQGLDSSRRNGGYLLLEILKFWESCKIFHELQIFFFHFY